MIAEIRSLRREELEEAWKLHEQGFPYLDLTSRESYLGFRSTPKFDFDQIIVAEADCNIVGKVEVYPWFGLEKARIGFIDGVIVYPAYRRQGIATRLLLEAEKRAAEKGIEQLELGAKTFAREAIALYEKLGYKKMRKVFFMKTSTSNLQSFGSQEGIHARQADSLLDPGKLIKMEQNV